jgi:glyoxylase-like metal-dependent hydrolase (beta-lactamase superfamily II)
MDAVMDKTVGGLQVMCLLDASGSFGRPWQATFPNAEPADWKEARALDPAAFGADGTWHLNFHCFGIRRPDGKVILVDSGVGPEASPASSWAPVPGKLPDALVEADIAGNDVEVVVITHLHEDHVGWAVQSDGTPLFPNARYIVQGEEVRHLDKDPDRRIWDYVVAPLRRAGQLEEVDGRTRLPGGAPGSGDQVTAFPTPGHTIGHQSVLVNGSNEQVIVTGDVLVHAVQLARPEVVYRFEHDQAEAARTRRRLLATARTEHAQLATAHLTRPFVRVNSAL